MKRLTQVTLVVALVVGLLGLTWLAMKETEWEERASEPPWYTGK